MPVIFVIIFIYLVRTGSMRGPRGLVGWLTASVALLVAFVSPLIYGVWLPDIFLVGSSRTLSEVTASSGSTYQVVQYWNHADFYTTELHVSSSSAPLKVIVLDGDDQKTWSVPLSVDEAAGLATVVLSGHRPKRVSLHDGIVLLDDTKA